MRVCIITTSYPRYIGDHAGSFVHSLAKELVKGGIAVCVVAPHEVNTKTHEFVDGVEIHRFQYWLTRAGQRVAYGAGMPDNIAKSVLAKIQLPLFIILFFIKGVTVAKRCDLIHAQFLLSGVVGAWIKRILTKNMGLVISARGSDVNLIPTDIFFQRIILKSLNSAGIITCVSSGIKNKLELLSVPEDKLIVIPNGVDLTTFSENRSQEKNPCTLVWVGRMVAVKGLQYLLKSLEIVKNRVHDGKLILVGDGPLRAELTTLSRELKVEEMISFAGRVEHNKIPDYLHGSVALVLSSTSEGFPNVIYEAMAMGRPVLSTNVGSIQDIIKDGYNGFLVEPKNPAQLAEKIIYVLENPAIAKEMGRNGKETILKLDLTWENTAKKTIAIYKSLLRGNGR